MHIITTCQRVQGHSYGKFLTQKCLYENFQIYGTSLKKCDHLLFIEQLHDLVGILVYGYVAGVDSQQAKEAETSSLLHTTGSITERRDIYTYICESSEGLSGSITERKRTLHKPTHIRVSETSKGSSSITNPRNHPVPAQAHPHTRAKGRATEVPSLDN